MNHALMEPVHDEKASSRWCSLEVPTTWAVMTGLDNSRANTTCARAGAYKADLFTKC